MKSRGEEMTRLRRRLASSTLSARGEIVGAQRREERKSKAHTQVQNKHDADPGNGPEKQSFAVPLNVERGAGECKGTARQSHMTDIEGIPKNAPIAGVMPNIMPRDTLVPRPRS